jgi:hypothetical protein
MSERSFIAGIRAAGALTLTLSPQSFTVVEAATASQ